MRCPHLLYFSSLSLSYSIHFFKKLPKDLVFEKQKVVYNQNSKIFKDPSTRVDLITKLMIFGSEYSNENSKSYLVFW